VGKEIAFMTTLTINTDSNISAFATPEEETPGPPLKVATPA